MALALLVAACASPGDSTDWADRAATATGHTATVSCKVPADAGPYVLLSPGPPGVYGVPIQSGVLRFPATDAGHATLLAAADEDRHAIGAINWPSPNPDGHATCEFSAAATFRPVTGRVVNDDGTGVTAPMLVMGCDESDVFVEGTGAFACQMGPGLRPMYAIVFRRPLCGRFLEAMTDYDVGWPKLVSPDAAEIVLVAPQKSDEPRAPLPWVISGAQR